MHETKHLTPNLAALYRLGGAAALIAAFVFRRNLGAEVFLFTGRVAPAAAADWFALLRDHTLLGLTLLNFFDIVNYFLVGLMILALYKVLRPVQARAADLAAVLALLGVLVFAATQPAPALLALSRQYASAPAGEQVAILAAGEARLAVDNPGANLLGLGGSVGLLCISLAGLAFSLLMLRGGPFSRLTAILGLIGNTIVLGFFLTQAWAPEFNFLPHSLAAIPLVVWEILIGLKLFKLARA